MGLLSSWLLLVFLAFTAGEETFKESLIRELKELVEDTHADVRAVKSDPNGKDVDDETETDFQAWKNDPQAWKNDPQAWKNDPQAWKNDPQAWKNDPQAWKNDPQAWKNDPQAWKNDPQAWKNDPQAWKNDPQAWKNDPQAWKNDPQAWKNDPQAWKNDPQAWKNDPQAWKNDPQAWRNDPQAWKNDPQAWKNDPQAWKNDPQAWKNDPQAWKNDPQAWKNDPQAWKNDPQAWKNDPLLEKDIEDEHEMTMDEVQNSPHSNHPQRRRVRVRLVGGRTPYEGRVEVLVRGRWGTVCDHFWGKRDADVVCRQLGYPRALAAVKGARYGQGTGIIWMDNVKCKGNEKNLGLCRFAGWGKHNCRHSNDAGVRCQPRRQPIRTYRLCEHRSGILRCPVGRKISIVYANYGRTTGRAVCPHVSMLTTNCRSPFSSQLIRCACNGRTSCNLYAKNEVYGDPCVGTFKYIEVRFKCV